MSAPAPAGRPLRALVALGSNLGDRRANLAGGVAALASLGAVTASPLVLETADESGTGPDYLNTVALLEARAGSPAALLEDLLRLELAQGRDRSAGRNAPRTLDLDLVAVEGHAGAWRWPSPPDLRPLGPELDLELPHPRAHRRPFVLEPLAALARLLPEGALPWALDPPGPDPGEGTAGTVTRSFEGLPKRDAYRILSSLVIPRPIAWITTVDGAGLVNLAPFSSFMGIFGPPMVAVTLARRGDGTLKDTHANLRARGEAVVHLVDLPLLEALHASGADPGPEVSEAARLGLATEASLLVAPPRLRDAPVALECRLARELELGPASTLVLLEVLASHAAARIWNAGHDCADAGLWSPVARLASVAGPNYGILGRTFLLGPSRLP